MEHRQIRDYRSNRMVLATIAGWAIGTLLGCGSETPNQPPRLQKSADATAPSPDGSTAGSPSPAPGPAGAEPTPRGGEGTGEGSDAPSLDFTGCGFGNAAADSPLVNGNFVSSPYTVSTQRIVFGIPVPLKATLTPSLTWSESLTTATRTTKVTAETDSNLDQAAASTLAQGLSGALTVTQVPLATRSAAMAGQGWDGIVCTVQPSSSVTTTFGGHHVTATFTPALPLAVVPTLDAEHYTGELATLRTFPDVDIAVSNSDDPALPAGTHLKGTVTLAAVAKVETIAVAGGSTLTIGGDQAFELKINAGTTAQLAALGLAPTTRFYIDTSKHGYGAVVTEADGTTTGYVTK